MPKRNTDRYKDIINHLFCRAHSCSATKFGPCCAKSTFARLVYLVRQYPASKSFTSSRFFSGFIHMKVVFQYYWNIVRQSVQSNRPRTKQNKLKNRRKSFIECKCCVTRNFDTLHYSQGVLKFSWHPSRLCAPESPKMSWEHVVKKKKEQDLSIGSSELSIRIRTLH